MLSYRVGMPGWKVAARLSVPVKFKVRVHKDAESGTYWAESDDLDGLVVSGETFEDLHREVISAAHTLLDSEVNGSHSRVEASLVMTLSVPCTA